MRTADEGLMAIQARDIGLDSLISVESILVLEEYWSQYAGPENLGKRYYG
jgi:hypothetical protein